MQNVPPTAMASATGVKRNSQVGLRSRPSSPIPENNISIINNQQSGYSSANSSDGVRKGGRDGQASPQSFRPASPGRASIATSASVAHRLQHPLARSSTANPHASGPSTPDYIVDPPGETIDYMHRAASPLRVQLGPENGSSRDNTLPSPRRPRRDSNSAESSPLLRVNHNIIDRPGTPLLQQQYLSMPHYYDETEEDTTSSMPTFLSTERGKHPLRAPTYRSRLKLLWTQTLANTISTCFLLFIVLWALSSRALGYVLATLLGRHRVRQPRPWDKPDVWQREALVKDIGYYARSCGYEIEDQEVVTEDGYKMRVHKVIAPNHRGKVHADGRGGFPVIIQHGLFQSSGSFVTSEERSLAFWLAEHGYVLSHTRSLHAAADAVKTSAAIKCTWV